jgi:predicted nuclease with TOPRIM domain
MSWLCLNCETVNFDAETKCIVCGDERYYTASEMKLLLDNHPEAKQLRDENKRLNTQTKWLQTRNKNLTQENKLLKEQNTPKQEDISILKEEIIDSTQESMIQPFIIKDAIQQKKIFWTHKVVFWQITTAVATLSAILIAVFKQ